MTELKRLRLPLNNHGSELVLVADRFEEDGRSVSIEVGLMTSAGWTWLEWDNLYDRLELTWRKRYE